MPTLKKKKPTAKKAKAKKTSKKTSPDIKVTVLAHKKMLVFIPEDLRDTKHFVPTTATGRLGTVMLDTKKNLCVSKEALELMKQIPRGVDAIGDISWWKCNDGVYAFSWFGPVFSVKGPMDALLGDRDWRPSADLPHTTVPNTIPSDVLAGLKKYEQYGMWKGPIGLGYPSLDTMLKAQEKADRAEKKKPSKKG